MHKAGLAVVLAAALWVPLSAKPKPAPKKTAPQVRLVLPFGVPLGKTSRVTIRGQNLDKTTAVRFHDPKVTAKITHKGKAPVPDKVPAKQVGDTQIEAEVTLPAGVRGDNVSFTVITPDGESKPHDLLIDQPGNVLTEKEPNDRFSQAQPLPLPGTVDGKIDHPQDVDVYRFTGKAGQKVVLEIWAARYGSALDSLLTVYDAAGRELASNDDWKGTRDSRLETVLPATGEYYAVIMDANDHGGPLHLYRLRLMTVR